MDRSLPLTYDECRARFRRAAAAAGTAVDARVLEARGPHRLQLSIDTVWLGDPEPDRALVVLSGVHGVEGFIGSALQTDLLERWAATQPPGLGVLLVHAVNPWGMAWWRRQNESNVDLNRNWRRSAIDPMRNTAYDQLHEVACPDGDELPPVDEVLVTAQRWVETRGLAWVRDGLTSGQYHHPDGLHYGGARTEESNRILESLVTRHLTSARRVLVVDLHTGHGPPGELTALSNQPAGSDQDRHLRSIFERVEATSGNPDATTGPKSGQIANGFAQLLPGATCHATSLEIGTVDDLTQLVATYQEQWVHRRGDPADPAHAAVRWAYRCCFTPDDRSWADRARQRGGQALDRARDAVTAWN